MKKEIAYIGIDIDDKAYHISGVNEEGVEITSFVVKGSVNKLAKELIKRFSNYQLNVCYEASYTGYSQARVLQKRGIFCAVIAPTSIPRSPNDRVKNDRIDALRLAQLWSKGSLSVVAIPTEEQEAHRTLVRAREFIVGQIGDLKRKIIAICREFGIDYKGSVDGAAKYWTKSHRNWLDQKIKNLDASHIELSFVLSSLIAQLETQLSLLDRYEQRIAKISEKDVYKCKVQALRCFKGIELTTAMCVLTEIFDIERFEHPKKLVAYLGLDVREYSSGGKQNQFGISKMGNRRVRKALTESCQLVTRSKSPTKVVLARRKGCPEKIVNISEKCRLRLYQKSHRLLAQGKHINKVKTACAREMVGFIWEALKVA